jgi:hypothetical protein
MPHMPLQPTVSRRGLLAGAGAAFAVAAAGLRFGLPPGWAAPVVSFHADAPYLDLTGRAEPLRARMATDWSAGLDHEAMFRLGHIF